MTDQAHWNGDRDLTSLFIQHNQCPDTSIFALEMVMMVEALTVVSRRRDRQVLKPVRNCISSLRNQTIYTTSSHRQSHT